MNFELSTIKNIYFDILHVYTVKNLNLEKIGQNYIFDILAAILESARHRQEFCRCRFLQKVPILTDADADESAHP